MIPVKETVEIGETKVLNTQLSIEKRCYFF